MSDTVKVLVWGTAEDGPCAYYRGYQYDEPLRALGVEMRHVSKVDTNVAFLDRDGKEVNVKALHVNEVRQRIAAGDINPVASVDKAQLEWADVVMFRRYYNTSYVCATKPAEDTGAGLRGCTFITHDDEEARNHEHGARMQDSITRTMWPLFRDHWDGGIIYETDDLHLSFGVQKWNGYYRDVKGERSLIAEMARLADLVTVTTPALARIYGQYNDRIRVIRNAIDPDLYVKDAPHPGGDKPRLVYYGSTARMRDYAGFPNDRGKWEGGFARDAVDANKRLLTRVFLGTNVGTERIIEAMFDEHKPYIKGIAAFANALANSHGDIGIAPLGGDDFDRCKSELHWLEYAMSDMAFIGQRFVGDGPYQVVRPGVDGLLARGRQEWHDAVKQLATSKDLRDELAGRAKERVLAEYDYRKRAEEWADAFRWVAEHPGIGKRELVAA